jgi:hypothetical protein
MRGALATPGRHIGWSTFFDFGDGLVKPNKTINTVLSSPLFGLPAAAIPGPELEVRALAQRNLLRHLTWRLPSGQRIARAMGEDALAPADLADLQDLGAGLDASTPLWFYVLREAEVTSSGQKLGPVGGRIVAEVIIELLQVDPTSYLNAPKAWTPTPGPSGRFTTADLLRDAGVSGPR